MEGETVEASIEIPVDQLPDNREGTDEKWLLVVSGLRETMAELLTEVRQSNQNVQSSTQLVQQLLETNANLTETMTAQGAATLAAIAALSTPRLSEPPATTTEPETTEESGDEDDRVSPEELETPPTPAPVERARPKRRGI